MALTNLPNLQEPKDNSGKIMSGIVAVMIIVVLLSAAVFLTDDWLATRGSNGASSTHKEQVPSPTVSHEGQ